MSVVIHNPETFRKNIRKMLNAKFNDPKHGNNLERGIFNYSIKEADRMKVIKKWDNPHFVLIYQNHLRSILSNLTEHWVREINEGRIASQKIAFMTHQELNHEKWSELIETKSKRDKNKFEVTMAASTDTFTCRKCKGNQCTYYLQQVRSADEPMTCFCTCITCGNRWKC